MVRMLHGLLLPRLAPSGGAPARNNLRNPVTGVCIPLYKNTEGSMPSIHHEHAQDFSSRSDPPPGVGSPHRQSGRAAPRPGGAKTPCDSGHAFARPAGASADKNAGRLQARHRFARRARAPAPARPRPRRIPSRYPARGKSSRLENASERRATPGCRRRWRQIHGNRGNHCRRRHRPDHHPQQEIPRIPPEKDRSPGEMRNPRQVAVVGVTGYSGLELARILLRHPALQPPVFYVRETNGAKCLAELFPQFRGWGEAPLRPLSLDAITSSNAGAAFLATPHEVSAELAPALIQAGLRVVDLSGAFRFREAETFSTWYKLAAPHSDWLKQAVYGIPELYSAEISTARLVANPGCYATNVILALRPLTEAGWIGADSSVICDCKSGASGAGKDLRRDLHFVEVDENFKAYGLFAHRHTPEVTDHLGLQPDDIIFSTHLLPLARGILASLYVWLDG